MNERPITKASGLGGRLPLLPPGTLDEAQHALRDSLEVTRVRAADGAGYATALPDGRLIGPFNVMLHVPHIAGPLLEWAQAITRSAIPADVREVVILTVAARWQAEYVLHAHTAAAKRAGVPEVVIAALRRCQPPRGLRAEAEVAHRLAVALVRDHHVTDGLYDEAVTAFGIEALIALINLIGQYLNTSALLACFRVPAPSQHDTPLPPSEPTPPHNAPERNDHASDQRVPASGNHH